MVDAALDRVFAEPFDVRSAAELEDLMAANEGLEDDCKKSLGMPAATEDESPPPDDSGPPADGVVNGVRLRPERSRRWGPTP